MMAALKLSTILLAIVLAIANGDATLKAARHFLDSTPPKVVVSSTYPSTEVHSKFQQWKEKFDREYESIKEEALRKLIWIENHAHIETHMISCLRQATHLATTISVTSLMMNSSKGSSWGSIVLVSLRQRVVRMDPSFHLLLNSGSYVDLKMMYFKMTQRMTMIVILSRWRMYRNQRIGMMKEQCHLSRISGFADHAGRSLLLVPSKEHGLSQLAT
mmetsp:Transcript_25277/g.50590  ORF Transcript_25277/g.50590 Transcript_25277/m.50590 type:complete len:216 (+) Transcript_25277:179-826(+)